MLDGSTVKRIVWGRRRMRKLLDSQPRDLKAVTVLAFVCSLLSGGPKSAMRSSPSLDTAATPSRHQRDRRDTRKYSAAVFDHAPPATANCRSKSFSIWPKPTASSYSMPEFPHEHLRSCGMHRLPYRHLVFSSRRTRSDRKNDGGGGNQGITRRYSTKEATWSS
jgi:hypothetical protein